eukprot:scaffold32031_cov63-Cyclotella_meneghiniana.AAC.6
MTRSPPPPPSMQRQPNHPTPARPNILTRNRKLSQNNVIFDCPQISFESSFTQKANDESSVVIGYGLNDCTGRLVEVAKEEVVCKGEGCSFAFSSYGYGCQMYHR